jgi:hypothetical protein
MQSRRGHDNRSLLEANHDWHNAAQSTPNHNDVHTPQWMPTDQEARMYQQRLAAPMQDSMTSPDFVSPHDYATLNFNHPAPANQGASAPTACSLAANAGSSNIPVYQEIVFHVNEDTNSQPTADVRNNKPCFQCQISKSKVRSHHITLFQF